ncbi:MAG: hypothetical protein ACRDBH_11635 [Bosea sp. (in: a-proteobacteria)]
MVKVKKPVAPFKPKDERWVEPWLIATGQPLKEVVAAVVERLGEYEGHFSSRVRDRRDKKLANHLRRIECLTVNLALAVLDPPFIGWIVCPLAFGGKGKTRYDIDGLDKRQTNKLVWAFAEAGLLHIIKGEESEQVGVRGNATKILPGQFIKNQIDLHGVTLQDFGRDTSEETIILKTTPLSADYAGFGQSQVYRDKERVDYADSKDADRLRDWMHRFNAYMAAADIAFLGEHTDEINPADRYFRRYFSTPDDTTTFRHDLGGRLFARGLSFIPRRDRHLLRLNGEEVVAVDWNAMNLRLAHVRAGAALPADDTRDLYDLPGIDLPRAGVKAAANALLSGADRYPAFNAEIRSLLYPDGYTETGRRKKHQANVKEVSTADIRSALLERHSALNTLLLSNDPEQISVGYRLQAMEAETLVAVIDKAMTERIALLPLHDALLVPVSKAKVTRSIMETTAMAIHGAAFPTKPKLYRMPVSMDDDGEVAVEWDSI